MQRVVYVTTWLLLLIATIGSTHLYLWNRWVRDTGLTGTTRFSLTLLLCSLGLLVPLSMIVGRVLSGPLAQAVWRLGLLWMGVFFISVLSVAAGDILLWLGKIFFHQQISDIGPSRRLFLIQMYGGLTAGFALFMSTWSFVNVRKGPRVVDVELSLDKWPKELDAFRIVQLSDLHIGPTVGKSYVEKMVAKVMALEPHLIVLTGDFVDGAVEHLREAVEPLRKLSAPQGVYFVTGNHEYYSGAEVWAQHFSSIGLRVLRNERILIESNNASFYLAGADDLASKHFGDLQGTDWNALLAERDKERCCLLLAHQPKVVQEMLHHDVDLIFSGHTHDGQIWPFGYLVRLVQPAVRGLSWFGTTAMYVNRGTGYWGPPMRLGTFSEITHMRLMKKK